MVKPRELEDLPFFSYLEGEDAAPHEGEAFDTALYRDTEFAGVRAGNLRFIESAFSNVDFGDFHSRRSRFNDVWLGGCRLNGTDLAETHWRDAEFVTGSLAGTALFDADFSRVTFFGCKFVATNFRNARLREVAFVNCTLREVDFADAELTGVTFPGSRIAELACDGVTASGLDFREASELDIHSGFDSLRGAKITTTQLFDLAPALAATLGLTVED